MVSPFPGMDAYLEQPSFWLSFHSRLIVAIADALAPQFFSLLHRSQDKNLFRRRRGCDDWDS